jgi:hypothetical protein
MSQAMGRSCCDRSGSVVLEFGFQMDPPPVYIYLTTRQGLLNSEVRESRRTPDLSPCDVN